MSHMLIEVLLENVKQIREEALISRINAIFADPEVVAEQRKMADDIAENTDIRELPW